jgi:hypothetical protein
MALTGGYDHEAQAISRMATDWSAFRMCPVCKAGTGEPCYSLSGRIIGGQPDNMPTVLMDPHRSRKARTGNRR